MAMVKSRISIVMFVLVALVFGACGKSKPDDQDLRKPESDPLRIGMTPDYPPMIFMQEGKYAGIEADFARGLAREFQRSLLFLPMKWEQLIPALMEGKVDLIMSGMTTTLARKMRIDFTEPYFTAMLVGAMRSTDKEKFASKESVLQTQGNIGVIPGTTADAFVQRNLPKARRIAIAEIRHAALELKTMKIDLFISDGPGVVWLVSENEAELAGFWEALEEEPLAWGVRRGDQEMLTSVNRILEKWKSDGTVDEVLTRWLPYLERIK
jgi:polar amino acid transport system substrate-binding protein